VPIIQGGPPEWVYERTPSLLKWELVPAPAPDDRPAYELRLKCGLEILRLQFFTKEEIQDLHQILAENVAGASTTVGEVRPSGRQEIVVSNPDFSSER